MEVDGVPVLKNLRVTFAGNRQMTLKCDLISGDKVEPIDVVLYSGGISVDRLSVIYSATGKDIKRGRNISIKILFDLLKRNCRVEAVSGSRSINKSILSGEDILAVIQDILEVKSEYKGGIKNDEITITRKKEYVRHEICGTDKLTAVRKVRNAELQ